MICVFFIYLLLNYNTFLTFIKAICSIYHIMVLFNEYGNYIIAWVRYHYVNRFPASYLFIFAYFLVCHKS